MKVQPPQALNGKPEAMKRQAALLRVIFKRDENVSRVSSLSRQQQKVSVHARETVSVADQS